MNKVFFLVILGCLINSINLPAQNIFALSGRVTDANNGDGIISASLNVKGHSTMGTRCNTDGFYSINLNSGTHTLIVQSVGYETQEVEINLNKDLNKEIKLKSKKKELKQVIIKTRKDNDQITNTEMGVQKLDMQMVNKIPVFFGERDILKTIQLLPGVKSAGEGNSGFYVRGGSADQNLVLLDEAPVYNATHLLGFFSVFNSDALNDVNLYKGTAPSQYGGRLSSVLDVKMKDGDNQNYRVSGGIGLIASRLNITGPIVKDKGSFLVSARRTYADMFTVFSNDINVQNSKLYFYDFNAKANYKINDRNRIYLSGYFGKDVLGFENSGIDWGNATGTLRWNHIFNNKLISNTSLIFSNFDYNIEGKLATTEFRIFSRIRDCNFKQDFKYFKDAKNEYYFGFNTIYHNIIPGAVTVRDDNQNLNLELSRRYGLENAGYASHKHKINKSYTIEYGMRLSSWSSLASNAFKRAGNNAGSQKASAENSNHKVGKTYVNVEPRVIVNNTINDKSSIKASYTRNTQNLHLLSNSNAGNPTDLWIGSNENIKPEISDQVTIGYFRNFDKNTCEFSAELYYKHMHNQIDYKTGAQLKLNENVESQLLSGQGRAYGLELFAKKKVGRINGWIGYTLSKAERKIKGINNNEYYNAKQDRTHEISIVGICEISKKLTFSSSWIYYTGNAVSFPRGKYTIDNTIYFLYSERNADRMPDYHRLDVGLTWTRKKSNRRESAWNFSIYNAYNRENAFSIDFQESPSDPTQTQAIQTTLFKIIPSISYNFKF